jgi:alpha-glucosidase (family GH31 glycosyl hydrolase)
MIVIVDAGISADDVNNKYYIAAQEKKVLMKSLINPTKFQGALSTHVWPKHTVFLDFFAKESADVWNAGLKDLYDLVPYDGIWLDMNEITGFCNGECPDYDANNDQYSKKRELAFLKKDELRKGIWYQLHEDQS